MKLGQLIVKLFGLIGIELTIKKGTNRIVWIFPGKGIAVKFPVFYMKNFVHCLWHYKIDPRMMFWFWTTEGRVMCSASFYLFKGVLDNWREYRFYSRHRKERFLLPTTSSLFGLINITPLGEEVPEELNLWRYFFRVTNREAFEDGHHFTENHNFCFYGGGIRILDYGDRRTQRILLRHFKVLNETRRELIT